MEDNVSVEKDILESLGLGERECEDCQKKFMPPPYHGYENLKKCTGCMTAYLYSEQFVNERLPETTIDEIVAGIFAPVSEITDPYFRIRFLQLLRRRIEDEIDKMLNDTMHRGYHQ